MSRIDGREPKHWHTAEGRHNMTDPRTIEGYAERFWATDERAYVAHLIAHETAESDPQRTPDDSPHVSALFDLLENRETQVHTIKDMIAATRRKERGE